MALASVAALVWLSLPVASGLFLGTLLAFSLLRVQERAAKRFGRPGLVALVLAIFSGLLIVGTVATLLYFVIARGVVAADDLARGFEPQGPLRRAVTHFEEATRSSPLGPVDVAERVRELARTAASKLTDWAAAAAGAAFSAFLLLLFTVMTTFFVLHHWKDLVQRAARMLPIHPKHTRVVLAEFQQVGKEVFVGTILTGVAQGILAAIGFALAGVPQAALLGALTAVASLVPAVGTLLVWVSVGVGLLVSGHPGAGIFELIWGTVVVGLVSDYVIRPKLVGQTGHVPTLLTFISLFGGVEVFGLLGLVLGPVIASVALAVLRTYDREECLPQASEETAEGTAAVAKLAAAPLPLDDRPRPR